MLMSEDIIEKDYFFYNAYYGRVLDAWVEYGMTLEKNRDECFLGVISNAEPLEYFDSFVEEWYQTGGEIATKEVNQWWASKNK